MTVAPRFNPFTPEFRRNPYPAYDLVRRAGCLRTLGTLVLARYGDVVAALKTRAFGVDLIPQAIERHAAKLGIADTALAQRFIRNSLVFTDNPAHVRLRRLLNQVFTQEALIGLKPMIEAAVRGRLDRLPAGNFDLIHGLAAPLPIELLCRWMSIPDEDAPAIARHVHLVRLLLDPGLSSRVSLKAAFDSLSHLTGYFLHHVERVRAGGSDRSLVAGLSSARYEGEGLSEEEIAFACTMCFVAGGETTQGLIGNVVHLLVDNPEQWRLLRDDASRWTSSAVEEAIRHETPLQLTKRLAVEAVDIGGEHVRPGEQVLLCLGGANRDPEAFSAPDAFDITRKGPPNVGFGHGMHACLGGALARLQAQVAVTAIVERYPHLQRAADAVWQADSLILRALASLPLRRSSELRHVRSDAKGVEKAAHLFCFPHAGGSASSFAAWRKCLPPAVGLHRGELPKRSREASHRLGGRVQDLIPGLAEGVECALAAAVGAPTYVLYGHSLGALVAYELAHHLKQRGVGEPAALFVSGRRAPACALRYAPLCDLPREMLIAELKRFKGMPDPILAHPHWFDAMQEDLREELALSDFYAYTPRPPLTCPLYAFKGADDPILDDDELAAWRSETDGTFTMDVVSGAHFFDAQGLAHVQHAIVRALRLG
ncbi:cytochrome P450 [Variovorax paradoxus]|nr:cytochrome P450 [Variovorax paradoxus]